MMRKIIFLDIDGVLAIPLEDQKIWGLCDKKQELLGKILNETNAEIVLSSSWRLHTLHETREWMTKKGFKYSHRITGITIRAYQYIDKKFKIHLSIPRGVEIKQWLDTNIQYNSIENRGESVLGEDYAYVILDDDDDMLYEHRDLFVHTHGMEGLSEEDTEKAIKILNECT